MPTKGTDSFVRAAPDSTGKLVRTQEITDSLGNLVEQEIVELADVLGNIVSVRLDTVLGALEAHDHVAEEQRLQFNSQMLYQLRLISYGLGKLIGEYLGPDPRVQTETASGTLP